MNIIKPLSTQISLSSTGNSFSNSTLVYVATTASSQVNVAYSNGSTRFTFTIPANQYMFVQKDATDLLSSNATVFAVAAAYRG